MIRSDNGTPFSGRAGISALSLWWVKLGITPERIAKGQPTQNGRHERIHRTLKADVITGQAKGSIWSQQRTFDRWRREYNEERPHEALNNETPATRYESSPRRYPSPLRDPDYGDDVEIQRAKRDGSIVVANKQFTISTLLAKELIGLVEQNDGSIDIHYGPLLLASISPKGRLRRGRKPTVRKTHTPVTANGGDGV